MTFCLGVKVHEGLVAIADTRVTSGTECLVARKVSTYHRDGQAVFVMTSGLRSLRDKTLTYFEEVWDQKGPTFDRLFKVVNALSEQVRRVAREDKKSLKEGRLSFNIHLLIGGQLPADREHRLFLMYPEGNWVEIGQGTPYHIIGASGYGKPVLDRTLKFQDSMPFALKVGCLAFDSTRISAADVDFPVDVLLYRQNSFTIIEQRFRKEDLAEVSSWWQERLRQSVNQLPEAWMQPAISRLPPVEPPAPE